MHTYHSGQSSISLARQELPLLAQCAISVCRIGDTGTRLQHATRMYEIRTAGVKGLGAFAKSAIPRGTRIFAERPLLAISADGDVYGASRRLSPEAREHFMQLSTHISKQLSFLRWIQVAWYTAKHTFKSVLGQSPEDHRIGSKRSLQEHMKALSIFRNNVFDLGNDRRAVFRNISRINHSCIPNAQGNFNDSLDRFTIHATRRIEQGEELTISYLQEHGAMRASRQQRLLDSYGFACACPACDSATKAGRDSDERRSKLHSELAEYAQVEGNTTEGELQLTERFIKLFEDESIAGRELSTM